MTRQPDAERQSISRLITALQEIQTELQRLDADFERRLQHSLEDADVRLQQQFVETRRSELKQAEEDVRKTVTRELLERFEIEFHKLGSDFENQRRQAVAAAESAAELRFKQSVDEWENEREHWRQKVERLEQELAANRAAQIQETAVSALETKVTEAYNQCARLEEELREAKSRWSSERNELKTAEEKSRQELLERFETQISQMKTEFEERRLKAIDTAEAAAEIGFEQKLAEAKQDFERREKEMQAVAAQTRAELNEQIEQAQSKIQDLTRENAELQEHFQAATARWNDERTVLEARPAVANDGHAVSKAAKDEIAKIEASIRDISRKIELVGDLGTEIRLNRERSELEAYLKGLRYTQENSNISRK